MWKAAAALLAAVLIAAGAVFILPSAAGPLLADALRAQTGAEDVQVSITESPRILLGEIGAIDGVIRQGRIGKVFVREMTFTGTHLTVDPIALLRTQRVSVTAAESAQLRGIVDADAVRELITNATGKFDDVAVTITPAHVLATAKTRAFGQTFEVALEGGFAVVSGDLYYKATRISARGMGLNALSLDALFPDVLVARADALPLGLVFESVETKDGIAILTAGK